MSDTKGPDLHLLEAVPADECGQPKAEAADAGPDDEARLSPKEIRFCDALSAGETSCQASKLAGITDRTGRRWRQRPEIQAAVRARLNDSLGAARACSALVTMADGSEPAESAHVSACRAVTEGAVKLCEVAELEARLAALEAQLTNDGEKPRWI